MISFELFLHPSTKYCFSGNLYHDLVGLHNILTFSHCFRISIFLRNLRIWESRMRHSSCIRIRRKHGLWRITCCSSQLTTVRTVVVRYSNKICDCIYDSHYSNETSTLWIQMKRLRFERISLLELWKMGQKFLTLIHFWLLHPVFYGISFFKIRFARHASIINIHYNMLILVVKIIESVHQWEFSRKADKRLRLNTFTKMIAVYNIDGSHW